MVTFRPRPTARAQELRNAATNPERRLWGHFSNRQFGGWKFSRQMPVGHYICDFLCREARLIVEVDGGQHCESERDAHRTAFLEAEGFRVVRFWNSDVLERMEGVLIQLAAVLDEIQKSPPPAPYRIREGKSRAAAKGWADAAAKVRR
jgi:very-short-patch-repair endonuclease